MTLLNVLLALFCAPLFLGALLIWGFLIRVWLDARDRRPASERGRARARARARRRHGAAADSRRWTGTIDWDPDAGLPMLGTILVKGPDFRVITQIFRRFLLATVGVVSVDDLSVELERASRNLVVRFRVTCEDGESVTDEVQFAIA